MSKKCAPRKRSKSSITCAAVSGGSASRICKHTTSSSQTNIGMRQSVMPGQRMQNTVVTRLAAVAMLPTPLTSRPTIQ